MHLYPYSGGPTIQTIFSIRNTATNYLSLQFFFTNGGRFNIWTNPPSGAYYVFSGNENGYSGLSALTFGKFSCYNSHLRLFYILLGSWNRVVVEIIQAQPLEIAAGYSSARIWVNGNVSPRVYFGNFADGDTPIIDGNDAALDLCGNYDGTTPQSTGTFDILNFIWLQGAEGVFQSSGGNIQYF